MQVQVGERGHVRLYLHSKAKIENCSQCLSQQRTNKFSVGRLSDTQKKAPGSPITARETCPALTPHAHATRPPRLLFAVGWRGRRPNTHAHIHAHVECRGGTLPPITSPHERHRYLGLSLTRSRRSSRRRPQAINCPCASANIHARARTRVFPSHTQKVRSGSLLPRALVPLSPTHTHTHTSRAWHRSPLSLSLWRFAHAHTSPQIHDHHPPLLACVHSPHSLSLSLSLSL